jgi:hypothetical protein
MNGDYNEAAIDGTVDQVRCLITRTAARTRVPRTRAARAWIRAVYNGNQ